VYQYGYASQDLLEAIAKNRIIIFEGLSRLRKFKSILGKRKLHYMIAGVLPPGKTIRSIVSKLKTRLLSRPGFSEEDFQKKLQDAERRVIPDVLKESHLIIRSG
jgi:hypothetical protein